MKASSTPDTEITAAPIETSWHEEDLEYLGCCPVCSDTGRSKLFCGLRDTVFRVAPGEWTLWRCAGCRVAYLDPRPNQSTIHKAYASYYTHKPVANADPGAILTRRTGLRGIVRNTHLNVRFGHAFRPSFPGAHLIAALFARRRNFVEYFIRHVPAPRWPGARLLDIGCGNGSFLKVAHLLGYNTFGIDPDPKAVATARSAGFEVRDAGLPATGFPADYFAAVTLSHVFEHLHDPVGALAEIHRILVPGGILWLSMPNLNAHGMKVFGAHWRGLEAPRHLVLYDSVALRRLLRQSGFERTQVQPGNYGVSISMFRQSLHLSYGRDPNENTALPEWNAAWSARAAAAEALARRDVSTAEFLTVTAHKTV